MWAHYADAHKGAVLGFRTEVLRASWPDIHVRQIKYSAERHGLLTLRQYLESLYVYELRPYDFNFDVWFTKSSEWEYESEWRLYFRSNGKNGRVDHEPGRAFVALPAEALCKVYLGDRWSHNENNWSNWPAIEKVCRLQPSLNKFQLEEQLMT